MLGDFLATMSIYIPYTYIPHMAMAKGVKVTPHTLTADC